VELEITAPRAVNERQRTVYRMLANAFEEKENDG
jgi:hypothetical protein